MNAFVDLFEKLNVEHFENAFKVFYKEEGPDLRLNDRVNDLITAFNLNQKHLISNLNDYEKLMNKRNSKSPRQLIVRSKSNNQGKGLKVVKMDSVEEDSEDQKKDDTYENFKMKSSQIFNLK